MMDAPIGRDLQYIAALRHLVAQFDACAQAFQQSPEALLSAGTELPRRGDGLVKSLAWRTVLEQLRGVARASQSLSEAASGIDKILVAQLRDEALYDTLFPPPGPVQ